MELSARAFGLNYWSVLVPQALEGVAAVGVLYTTVRRWFGPAAGIIAGAVMAVTPVATLMFRFNNPDALLVLALVLAAYTTTRALESGKTRWLALTGALLGFGFLTKMLQAFLVLPVFALVYLVAGPPRLGRRIWQLLAGGAALFAAAGWWVAVVMLTPAAGRPYVGGSADNSILQLTFGYNGLGRLNGNEAGSVGFRNGAGPSLGLGNGARPSFGGQAGLTRLFGSEMGGQISWLIPAALIALAALRWMSRRAPRTDRTRSAALLWGGWLVLTGLVFSYMSGIIHPYYTVALAPAVGALTGIGAAALWRDRHSAFARVVLAAMLVAAAGWAWVLLGRSPGWYPWLRAAIALAASGSAGAILAWPRLAGERAWAPGTRAYGAMAVVPIVLAMVAGLGGPLAYSINTAATAHTGALPSAGPTVAGAFGGPGGPRRRRRGRPPRCSRRSGRGRRSRWSRRLGRVRRAPPRGARPDRRGAVHRWRAVRRWRAIPWRNAVPRWRARRAGGHRRARIHRSRRAGWKYPGQRRAHQPADDRGLQLHVGGRHGRFGERRPAPARYREADLGDRRIQRNRPHANPRPVPETRLRTQDPLLRWPEPVQLRRGIR